jgi:hypothetical protein
LTANNIVVWCFHNLLEKEHTLATPDYSILVRANAILRANADKAFFKLMRERLEQSEQSDKK